MLTLGENNPFASSAAATRTNRKPLPSAPSTSANPFGDDDDYDDQLNPFAE